MTKTVCTFVKKIFVCEIVLHKYTLYIKCNNEGFLWLKSATQTVMISDFKFVKSKDLQYMIIKIIRKTSSFASTC